MRFGYRFSNLCGTVYKQGNLQFTPDGIRERALPTSRTGASWRLLTDAHCSGQVDRSSAP